MRFNEPTGSMPLLASSDGSDSWLDDAACADLPIESFFVRAGHVIDEEILNLCRGCPVRLECVKHSYNEDLNITGGYFGGLSPGQRREMSYEEAVEYCKTDTVEAPRTPDIPYDADDEPIIYS